MGEKVSDGSVSPTQHRQGKDQAQGLPTRVALAAPVHHWCWLRNTLVLVVMPLGTNGCPGLWCPNQKLTGSIAAEPCRRKGTA